MPDQGRALAELFRVLKPEGSLRFYEHVAADNAAWARRQRRVDRVWPMFAGGCHHCRNSERAIAEAGFVIDECDRFLFAPCWAA